MPLPSPDRGASRASQVRGARTPHHHARPVRGSDHSAILERVGDKILRALVDGPRTLGELSQYFLGGNVPAATRDEAIERLLLAGKVRMVKIPNPAHSSRFHRSLCGLDLPRGGPDR